MLSFDQFYKEVRYKSVITGGAPPNCVYAWVVNDSHKLTLITKEQFKDYEFIGYRYPNSNFPNVKSIK